MIRAVLPVGEARRAETRTAGETADPVAVQEGVKMLSRMARAQMIEITAFFDRHELGEDSQKTDFLIQPSCR